MAGTRAVIAAAAVLLAGPTLAGCSGGDPVPKVEPSSSVSSPTGHDTTVSPAEDRGEVVIQRFFGAVSVALSDGHAQRFLRFATPNCVNCHALARTLREQYSGGGRIKGGHWAVTSVNYVKTAALGRIWNVDVHSARERWVDGNGNLVKIVRSGVQHFGVAVTDSDGVWLVRELKLRSR